MFVGFSPEFFGSEKCLAESESAGVSVRGALTRARTHTRDACVYGFYYPIFIAV